MLVNNTNASSTSHVKFVSYDGQYPNLCSGLLVLNIDGAEYRFGIPREISGGSWDKVQKYIQSPDYHEKFWSYGGSTWVDGADSGTSSGEWEIDVQDLPQEIQKDAAEIDEVFNSNVPYGCCGGCI